jgi:hypothetical protein
MMRSSGRLSGEMEWPVFSTLRKMHACRCNVQRTEAQQQAGTNVTGGHIAAMCGSEVGGNLSFDTVLCNPVVRLNHPEACPIAAQTPHRCLGGNRDQCMVQ